MIVEVKRYRKSDGWTTRYWAVYVDEELLAVVLYRKGAEAVALRLLELTALVTRHGTVFRLDKHQQRREDAPG